LGDDLPFKLSHEAQDAEDADTPDDAAAAAAGALMPHRAAATPRAAGFDDDDGDGAMPLPVEPVVAAQVRIDTLEVMNMSGKLDIREALDWAAANRDMLMAKWEEFSGDGV
jgi:hypothetical protein